MVLVQKALAFVRATLVGGVFVLAPIAIVVFILGKAFVTLHGIVQPLFRWIHFESIGGMSLTVVAVVALIITACFLAGLLANIGITKWLVESIEAAILSHLPGYTLMKSMTESVAGVEDSQKRATVLVNFADRTQIGFVMDQLPDLRLVVFVPNVPSPWSGNLYIVAPEQTHPVAAPIRQVVDRLQRLGNGMATCFREQA